MLPSPLLPSFLTHTINVTSWVLRTYVFINFLTFCSICSSSPLVHFKNSTEYLKMGTAKLFISLMRFRLESLVSRIFLDPLRYSYPRETTMMMYKNINGFFSFTFIIRNVRMGRVRENQKWLSLYTHRDENTVLLWHLSAFLPSALSWDW